MKDSLVYKMTSGKPIKILYFIRKFWGLVIPDAFYRCQTASIIKAAKKRSDFAEISRRVDYYCHPSSDWDICSQDTTKRERSTFFYRGTLGGFKRRMFHNAYYFDQHDVTRYFPKQFRWSFCPGDVYFTPSEPTVVKSRMLTEDNSNSILLKLDKLRHFLFLNDTIPFAQKKNLAIFRGKIRQSRLREAFLTRFFDHSLFDCGVVGKNEGCPDAWMKPKKTIREHLDYKFIIALEGNDVASNLKWVMSSNSLAVMTRPTCETWFMEGLLKPGVHYVEVKEDFSDVEEKINYYITHTDEAQAIINNAHAFVAQFFDKKREQIIQIMVLQRYFEKSHQLNPTPIDL